MSVDHTRLSRDCIELSVMWAVCKDITRLMENQIDTKESTTSEGKLEKNLDPIAYYNPFSLHNKVVTLPNNLQGS